MHKVRMSWMSRLILGQILSYDCLIIFPLLQLKPLAVFCALYIFEVHQIWKYNFSHLILRPSSSCRLVTVTLVKYIARYTKRRVQPAKKCTVHKIHSNTLCAFGFVLRSTGQGKWYQHADPPNECNKSCWLTHFEILFFTDLKSVKTLLFKGWNKNVQILSNQFLHQRIWSEIWFVDSLHFLITI